MVYRRIKAKPTLQSAHAILLVSGKYALQLRDNRADIAAAGQWSLFGGLMQSGESPREAIEREISEELCLHPAHYRPFGFRDHFAAFEKERIRTWLFVCDLTDLWETHRLMEGQKTGLFPFERVESLDMQPVMRKILTSYHQRGTEFRRRRA